MRSTTASILVILALTGCPGAPEPESTGSPPGATPAGRANPLFGAAEPAATERTFAGRVLERLPAGGYSYLAVDRGDSSPPTWVATMGRGAEVGTRVRVEGFAAQDQFHSRRLDRRFDRIVFGVVEHDAG
jgi:hypothetical protein